MIAGKFTEKIKSHAWEIRFKNKLQKKNKGESILNGAKINVEDNFVLRHFN